MSGTCQAVGFELLQDQADLAVELAGRVQILRPILPRDRVVGVVGRDYDLGRIGLPRRLELTVRLLEVDLGEEWLVRLQVGPAVRVKRLTVVGEVPVSLARAREPAGLG
jgi:hypothetical protein